MNRVTITCSNGSVELSEFVEDLYSVSEKANRALKELRIGLPTWAAKETYNKMQISLWIYDNIEVNAFCHYENGQNYIALSVGLLTMLWKEAEEFISRHGAIVKTPSGYWQQVPQVSIAQQYMKQMSKFCEQFGLTPASRSRIVTDRGNDSSDDAMEQLLSLGGEKK